MTTRTRLLLSIAASVIVFAVTSVPIAGQLGRPGGLAGVDGASASPAAPAGPIPRRPDGHPDLTGTFNGSPGGVTHTVILEEHPAGFGVLGGKSLIIDPANGIIPYQPWALAERDRRREDSNGYEDQVGHCEFYDIGRIHSFTQEYMFSGNNFVINATQHSASCPWTGASTFPRAFVSGWEIRSDTGKATRWSSTVRISMRGRACRLAATFMAPTSTSSSASRCSTPTPSSGR